MVVHRCIKFRWKISGLSLEIDMIKEKMRWFLKQEIFVWCLVRMEPISLLTMSYYIENSSFYGCLVSGPHCYGQTWIPSLTPDCTALAPQSCTVIPVVDSNGDYTYDSYLVCSYLLSNVHKLSWRAVLSSKKLKTAFKGLLFGILVTF